MVITEDLDSSTHQGSIAPLSTTPRSITIHPPLYIRLQNKFMDTSVPITGSVSTPNGGRDFCVFVDLRMISADCSGQDETEVMRGVQNCSAVQWRVGGSEPGGREIRPCERHSSRCS